MEWVRASVIRLRARWTAAAAAVAGGGGSGASGSPAATPPATVHTKHAHDTHYNTMFPPPPLPSELRGTGAAAVSIAQYQANEQIEDRYAVVPHARRGFLVATVLDGHGGWQVAEFARSALPDAIVKESDHATSVRDPTQLAAAAVRAFQRVDRVYVDGVRQAYGLGFGDVARVGCCAISAIVSPQFVVVANAGDCRAVLGRVVSAAALGPAAVAPSLTGHQHEQPQVYVQAVALSHDHNARVPREAAKLRAAHPGENDIVVCKSPTACYVKGRLQPTRALGDAYLKYSEFNAPPGARWWGRHIPPPYTPPYITATPETRVFWLTGNGTWPTLQAGRGLGQGQSDDGGEAAAAAEEVHEPTTPSPSSANTPLPGLPTPRRAGALSVGEGTALAMARAEGRAEVDSNSQDGPQPRPWWSWFSRSRSSVDGGSSDDGQMSVSKPGGSVAMQGCFLILACDGVWDVVTNEEAVRFVAEDDGDRTTVAHRLIEYVLEREAENADMELEQMKALPPGRQRRVVHDDITVVVVFLDGPTDGSESEGVDGASPSPRHGTSLRTSPQQLR